MPETGCSCHNNALQPHLARVARVLKMTEDTNFYQLRLEDRELAGRFDYHPGQFLQISVLGTGEAPISISSTPTRRGVVELCVRRVGRVTQAIHRLETNAVVGLRGPYGKGWPVDEMRGKDVLLIAGGLGMAPLRSLLGYILDNRRDYGRVQLLYGARTPADLLFRDELSALAERSDVAIRLTVDRDPEGGWPGPVGVVTGLFDTIQIDSANTYAAVCVPPAAFKFVVRELLERRLPGERILMSLERKMNCGVGKCGNCCVGPKYTCLDGPVFTYWDAARLPGMI